MLYKILNKLFGWDYVAWANIADNDIARVYPKGGNEYPYYFRYRLTKVIDQIRTRDQVI